MANGELAQCMFPSAFPAQGPNIIQRFWIRLFWTLAAPFIHLYSLLQPIYHTLVTSDWAMLLANTDQETLMLILGENSWSIIIGMVVVGVLSVLAWFFSPKGENNTVWRSTLILSFVSCYIMWAITFLAQWHPLIQPKMAKLRPGYDGMS